ncbi:MAG: hypothetical protein GY803_26350 [Chloroflexi bacterium]|nr:hypothetical protein [Chloroflexota bacterium]
MMADGNNIESELLAKQKRRHFAGVCMVNISLGLSGKMLLSQEPIELALNDMLAAFGTCT